MRPARMTIVALAGMIALHVFMLAGHGRGHDVGMGDAQAVAAHAGSPTSPSLSAPMPADQDAAGMDMTVACLAVLAGLLLLLPARKGLLATAGPGRLAAIGHCAHPERAGSRTRSPTELCVSLT
jgi:hypothetical protein